MSESLQDAVARLVHKCEGNQAAAARRSNLSVALISNIMRGCGPVDPRTPTIEKVYTALSEPLPAAMVRTELTAKTEAADRHARLAEWLRRIESSDPNLVGIIHDLAKRYGFSG